MSELVVTKQQIKEALDTLGWGFLIENDDFVNALTDEAGFVVLNKKALFGRLTSGNAKAEIANKLIKEILGDKPE
jgi:hypothetical protein